MGLKISTIRAGVLAALLTFSAAGCKKAATFKRMPKTYVAERVHHNLDSIRNATVNIISNGEYKLIGRDTVKLENDFMLHPKKFMEKQNKALMDKYTETVKGKSKFDYITTPDGDAYIYNPDRYDKYINKTTVIRNTDIYTTDYTDMYVGVEHYAKINPKAVPFMKEK